MLLGLGEDELLLLEDFGDFSELIGVDVSRGGWSGVLFNGERRKELNELRRFISDLGVTCGLSASCFLEGFLLKLSVLN